MSVKAIMSTPVITVERDDKLELVNEIFSNTKFHHVLVVEDKVLYGVVSDRDLFKALSPNLGTAAEKLTDLATLNKRVHQVMTRSLVCIGQSDSVHKAVELFLENRVSCLPVVDSHGIPVGIITWRDLLRAIKKPKVK